MNTGTEQTNTVIGKPRLGRPIDPNCFRTIYLNADNTPRAKGAPKVGSSVKAVDVQRSVKNSDFVYGVTPMKNERMEVVGPRNPRKKVVVNIPNVPVVPVAEVAAMVAGPVEMSPVENVAEVVGEGAVVIPN